MSQMRAGAILSYFSLFLTMIIALIYTPILIRILGQAEYGLYMLIGSVAAYLSIMDLGLGNAIIRFTARNRVDIDKLKEEKLNGMFLIFYSIIALITVVIGIFIYSKIEVIFGQNLTTTEIKKAQLMVIVLIINFALSFPLSVFGSILQAYEKFIVVKVVNILRLVLTPLFTLPIILVGYGSVSMVIISTVVNLICLSFNFVYARKYLNTKFSIGSVDKVLVFEILSYSFFIFLNIVIDQIYWNTNQIILGIVSGTIPVAIFAIAIQFIKLYMQFSTSISGLFLPKITIMVAKNASNKSLSELMSKFGRIQYAIIAFILSGFILFGKKFLILWAGEEYITAYYIIIIIMIPLTIPLIQNIGISILYAKNKQIFRIVVLFFISILNIILTVPLANEYNGIGAAIATCISLIIGHIIIMNIYYFYKIKLDIFDFWLQILKLTLPVGLSLTIGSLYLNLNFSNGESLFIFILEIICFAIVYISLMWWLGFNEYEKQLINQVNKQLKKKVIELSSFSKVT